MNTSIVFYAALNLFGVFISAVSQVLLKKSADRKHESALREYLNPFVVFAYVLFVASTLLSVFSYKGIPLSMGPILEATGYLWVTLFGITIFGEQVGVKKAASLCLIIGGIVVYALGA